MTPLKGKNNASLRVTAAVADRVALPEWSDISDFIGLCSSSYITVQGSLLPVTSLYRALFFQLHHCTGLSSSSYITVQGSLLPVTSLYRAPIFQLHHCTITKCHIIVQQTA